jgi:hypothetical protein
MIGTIDMQSSVTDLLHAWHDFYLLAGTASATLVGLMFVAASIGAQVFTEENRAAMEAFISPTVVHFCTTLFVSIIATVPVHSGLPLAVLFILIGLAGLIFAARVWIQLLIRRRFQVDVIDRMFYALIPCVGHLLVVIAGVALVLDPALGLDCLAAAALILLFAGIRNAWDMTIWIVIKIPIRGTGNEPPA